MITTNTEDIATEDLTIAKSSVAISSAPHLLHLFHLLHLLHLSSNARVTSVKSSKGIITHQGHISQVD